MLTRRPCGSLFVELQNVSGLDQHTFPTAPCMGEPIGVQLELPVLAVNGTKYSAGPD